MAKRKEANPAARKAGAFVLGRNAFAKISAVEGIHLTEAAKTRASIAGAKKLSAEETREMIIRSYRKV